MAEMQTALEADLVPWNLKFMMCGENFKKQSLQGCNSALTAADQVAIAFVIVPFPEIMRWYGSRLSDLHLQHCRSKS